MPSGESWAEQVSLGRALVYVLAGSVVYFGALMFPWWPLDNVGWALFSLVIVALGIAIGVSVWKR